MAASLLAPLLPFTSKRHGNLLPRVPIQRHISPVRRQGRRHHGCITAGACTVAWRKGTDQRNRRHPRGLTTAYNHAAGDHGRHRHHHREAGERTKLGGFICYMNQDAWHSFTKNISRYTILDGTVDMFLCGKWFCIQVHISHEQFKHKI
jgi:hypothetical protein